MPSKYLKAALKGRLNTTLGRRATTDDKNQTLGTVNAAAGGMQRHGVDADAGGPDGPHLR